MVHMPQKHTPLSRGAKAAIALGAGAVGVVAATAAVSAALGVYVARQFITPAAKHVEDIEILGVTDSTITLSSTPETRTPGRYGILFSHGTGYAQYGQIISRTSSSVTRELLGVPLGDLTHATRGRFSGWFYLSPRDLGVDFEDALIETEVGFAPAWLVPGGDDWVIQVHGRGVIRSECVRAIPVFKAAGFTSLLISYRNDGVAPDSTDRRYALGAREWRDVDAAIGFALEHGARRIVLMGWSMGGATSLQASVLSKYRDSLTGLVLESPVVDWRHVLDFQSEQQKVPAPIRRGAIDLIGRHWGGALTGQAEPIDLDSLDWVSRAEELSLPTLLLHSATDGYVPVDASRELARRRPDLITYEEFPKARHVKLWNYDEERWTSAIAEWLARLPR
jgi:pimeloyl-ACP methyl ester carboxylesterase